MSALQHRFHTPFQEHKQPLPHPMAALAPASNDPPCPIHFCQWQLTPRDVLQWILQWLLPLLGGTPTLNI
jgi:hypothetical protein